MRTLGRHRQRQTGGESLARGWQVRADVQNPRNTEPPFCNGGAGGDLGAAWRYKGFVSNPLYHLVSLGLRVRF
jgi:hypothetical protein